MKYMLLIYSNPEVWEGLTADQRQWMYDEAGAIMGELKDSGEWVGGEPLADPANTKSVRPREGVPTVTDGPFIEAKEHLAGYCMIDCETLERATEIAVRWPDSKYSGVELRPVMDMSQAEM